MNGNYKTFAQQAESVLSMVLYVGGQSGMVDVVFAVYRQPSINDCERLNRSPSTTIQNKCLEEIHVQFLQQDELTSGNYNDTEICYRARHCL